MERRGGAGILHSLLQNPKKPQIWKLNMDINRGGYGEKREVKKMPPETARISHPKTLNNTKTFNNTRRQLKTPENNNQWRWAENISTRRRAEYEEKRKIWENSTKEEENSYPTRLWRMSEEDSKLGEGRGEREKGENTRGGTTTWSDYGRWLEKRNS